MVEGERGKSYAVVSLVLGIVSLGVGIVMFPLFFLGVPAWIFGWAELRAIRSGRAESSGRQFAQAGTILGIISTTLGTLITVVGVAFVLFLRATVLPMVSGMVDHSVVPAVKLQAAAPKAHQKPHKHGE